MPARQPRVAHRGHACPTSDRPIVVYCAAGPRSAFATKTLEELGYENVVNLDGGYTDWKRNGFRPQLPRSLDAAAAQPLLAATC